MRGKALLTAAAAIGISALAAGCGQQHGPGTGAPDVRAAVRLKCVTPKLDVSRTFSITEKANGKTFCVVAGTGIYVFLHGAPGHMWAQIHPSSAVLVPRPSGVMSLAIGVTGGFFGAGRLGTATLTSTRTPCRVAMSPEPYDPLHCAPRTLFKVTIVVRGRM